MRVKIWPIKSNLLGLIDIKSEDYCAAFGEMQRERKTDVTEVDGGYFAHDLEKKLKARTLTADLGKLEGRRKEWRNERRRAR